MFSVVTGTLPVGAIVGIVIAALVIPTIVIVVAVAVFARWWNKKDSGTFNLTTDVSMECSMHAAYCTIARICLYMAQDAYTFVYDDVVMCRTGYHITGNYDEDFNWTLTVSQKNSQIEHRQ